MHYYANLTLRDVLSGIVYWYGATSMRDWFSKFARKISEITGSYWAFLFAIAIIVVWAFTGPIFHFADTWQLVINTGTTIATFLMVFLIQNTQNRDAKAMHLKLDEIIRAMEPARNSIIELEELTDEELDRLEKEFLQIRKLQPETEKQIQKELDEAEAQLKVAEREVKGAEKEVKEAEHEVKRTRQKPA
jgi:low affinity Fe/Cu permease